MLVNIPEHAMRWEGEHGGTHYRQYLAALRTFAAAQGVVFVDPTDGDPHTFHNDDEYSDTYHMSPVGANRLTSMLAARLAARTLMARIPPQEPRDLPQRPVP
jgi:hypothetical protein